MVKTNVIEGNLMETFLFLILQKSGRASASLSLPPPPTQPWSLRLCRKEIMAKSCRLCKEGAVFEFQYLRELVTKCETSKMSNNEVKLFLK